MQIRVGERIDPRSKAFPLFSMLRLIAERAEIEDSCRQCKDKARRYDILKYATPTQFSQMWDRMIRGENFDALVDELGRVQDEMSARDEAEE